MHAKVRIFCSLASYKRVYYGLHAQSYVGLSVNAAKLMAYCRGSFCLRRFRGSSFASAGSDSTGDVHDAPNTMPP